MRTLKENWLQQLQWLTYLKSYKIEISDDELKEYFNVNEEDYNFSDDAYILNLVSFSNEESAIRFRNNAIIDGWEKAVED